MPTTFSDFVHQLRYEDLPADVLTVLRRSVVDTMGVAIVGSSTGMSAKARLFARRFWAAGEDTASARILFDGHCASAPGAAMAGAFTIDSIDAHDGYSAVKGHAGSAIFPGVVAAADMLRAGGHAIDGRSFITAIAVGYEVAYRAGLTLHATTPDYHTSGAWTAVGVAAAVGKLIGLDPLQIRHAAGIAEYHGPRSQMMRCIDFPTMLRDGVGWGAPTGVSSALMAQLGFTGAPAITAEGEQAAPYWSDLGTRWEIGNTHYKPYPVCRWAHSSIDAAADLMRAHGLASRDIERVRIQTFHYATRLAGHAPKTLDEITYSIAFPVAVMIVRGQIGIRELEPTILEDEEVRRVSNCIELVETEHYTRISTRLRWADVTLFLKDGRVFQSDPRTPRGDPELPLSDTEIAEKYHSFADPLVGIERADQIEELSGRIDAGGPVFERWMELVRLPVASASDLS